MPARSPRALRARAPAPAPRGRSTSCVHGGERTDPATGAVNTPVHLSTTYRYPELEDGRKAPYIYTRYTNPSWEAVERKVAGLEGADASLLFGSGMAAIQAAVLSCVPPGSTVAVQQGVYGGTTALLRDELAPLGIKAVPFDAYGGRTRLPKGTALAWMEAVTNPLLRVADVDAWAEAARAQGALLAVDATFASPVLQQPLRHGADLAMHSATKYLSGHSDVTAGVLSCRADLLEGLWRRRRNLGAILDPMAAFLLGRGIKTLALRMERHCRTAQALAETLEAHPAVRRVHYPGLASHPDHEVAQRMLSGGFGGMLTLDLGSLRKAQAFRRRLRLVTPASSLGGVESLASLPVETSHSYVPAAERRAQGITDGLVRLSIGIEDLADLEQDLRQALG